MLGVIVLAGGRGRRMGGVDKAAVRVDGERLIDRLLRQLPYSTPTAVVSPYHLGMPQVCEQPAFGGPVAGIAAGLAALSHTHSHIAVLSVDAPDSPRSLPALQAALGHAPVAVTSHEGRIQPLCAVWKRTFLVRALSSLGDPRHQPAMRLLRAAGPAVVIPGDGTEQDYDTFDDLQQLGPARATSYGRPRLVR